MITRILVVLFLIACVLLPVGAVQAQGRSGPVGVGEIAPDFTLVDQNGQKHSLSAERGKQPVILVFYRGHW